MSRLRSPRGETLRYCNVALYRRRQTAPIATLAASITIDYICGVGCRGLELHAPCLFSRCFFSEPARTLRSLPECAVCQHRVPITPSSPRESVRARDNCSLAPRGPSASFTILLLIRLFIYLFIFYFHSCDSFRSPNLRVYLLKLCS